MFMTSYSRETIFPAFWVRLIATFVSRFLSKASKTKPNAPLPMTRMGLRLGTAGVNTYAACCSCDCTTACRSAAASLLLIVTSLVMSIISTFESVVAAVSGRFTGCLLCIGLSKKTQ